MGGAYSNGQDNDELVDHLVDSGYIRTKKIEQVFRAVDRGDYFLSSHVENAYKDFAWKHGNIHLSAPCIYCEVMEELALQPGLSFLNLGSGTGYLSTMAGLLLTQSGTNHGIELHEDCVRYSYDRLEEFKQKSLALDEFDFCEPVFVQGNCLSVQPGRRYDRVYCGAACPESHVSIIKEFVKVGGILVMPYKDHLVKVKRIEEIVWKHETMLPVSFINLVIPTSSEVVCCLPNFDPLSLQELCRSNIRRRLQQNVWKEHSDLEIRKPIAADQDRTSTSPRSLRPFVIPIFEEPDENLPNEDEEARRVHRIRLLLNVDGPPGENLCTTLEFVRAVTQPTRNELRERSNDEMFAVDFEFPDEPSTEDDTRGDTNFSSELERQDSESSSDSACEKSQSESNNIDSTDRETMPERPSLPSGLSAYSNMSESDSEVEEFQNREARARELMKPPTLPVLRKKKKSRKDKADSGIVDDTANDEASFSSDSDFTSGTPVRNKRSNTSPPASPSSRYPEPSCKRSPLKRYSLSDENDYTTHYIDTNAFSSYMKEKIQQLPLPYSLKSYINYNRNL